MKAHLDSKALFRCFLTASALLFAAFTATPNSLFGQSVTYDFRFDGQTGAAATTQTLTPGSAGQTFTIDVWVTVFGDAAHTNTSQYGLSVVRFRGFSDIVSGGGAFATGAGIGVTGSPPFNAPAGDPFNGFANSGTQVKDVGSTTGNGAVGSTTADGIVDFGSNANNSLQDIIVAKTTPVMAGTAGAFGSVNGAGYQFLVAQFKFTTGTARATDGAETQFWAVKSTNGTSASVVLNGDATGNSNVNVAAAGITVGSPLTFVLVKPKGSASWNRNANGNYSDLPNWDPNQIPDGAALVASFGNGTTTTVNIPNITVTVDAAVRVGTLNFNNTNGTSFTLGNDGVAGHTLTLDNNGAGATINSLTGNNWIFPNLVLADSATFNVAAGSSVLVSLGNISESGASRGITKTGAGTLTIDTTSAYTGTTLVTAGTLVTTPTGTISTGPLVVSAANGVSSVVSLNNDQSVSSLSGTVAGSGVATVNVASGTTLTVAQATDTTFDGKLSLASGSATFVKSSSGRLETKGAPTLGNGSVINVTGGTLRFNATSGAAIVGTGVTATVSGAAVLELAGSVSALSSSDSPAHRVNITNNSTAAAGLLVTGTNQQVGKIDGPGSTSVATGGSLTANHIIQSALVIGGTAGTPAIVTIAASDSAGNALAQSSGFALPNLLSSGDPLGAGTLGSSSLSMAGGAPSDGPSLAGAAVGNLAPGAGSAAVPEPSALALIVLGCAFTACLRKHRPATRLR